MIRIITVLLLGVLLSSLLVTSAVAGEPTEVEPNVNPSELFVTIAPGECKIFTKSVLVNPPDPVNPGVPYPEIPGEFKITPRRLPSPPNPIDVRFDPTEIKTHVEGSPWPVIIFNEKICASPNAPYGYYKIEFAFEIKALNGYKENLGKQVIHVTIASIGSRTLGFYKNHPCVVEQVMPNEGIQVGEIVVYDASILKDRRNHVQRLRGQLLTTKLNNLVFGIGRISLDELGLDGQGTVNDVVAQADSLLIEGPFDKETLSDMQDLLDDINNSNLENPLPEWIINACQ